MKRLAFFLLAASLCLSQQSSAFWNSRGSDYNVSVGAACDATHGQAGTFLGRTSGLSGTESSAYVTMICGLVTDGIITGNMGTTGCGSVLDALYIFSTNTDTTAKLNLCGTSFSITANGSPAFTADNGYVGASSGKWLDTGYNPNANPNTTCGNGAATCNYTRDSGAFGVYSVVSAGNSVFCPMGQSDGTTGSQIFPFLTGVAANSLNSATGLISPAAGGTGLFVLSRTASNLTTMYTYVSGGSLPDTQTSAGASSANANFNFFILARNNSGTADVGYGTTGQVAASFISGGLSSAQVGFISSRINAFMTALGINKY